MTKPHYTIGNKFGRLTILAVEPKFKVLCQCDCGQIASVTAAALRSGKTQSCGCLQRQRAAESNKIHKTVHGQRNSPEYNAWRSMRKRCFDPSNPSFHSYGGRGITVCPEWESFAVFLADMGPRAPGLSLDRKDNLGNYDPRNCRWATGEEQQNNKRDNVRLTYLGETKTVAMWAESLGMSRRALYARISNGWSHERTLTQPVRENTKRGTK